MKTLLGNSPGVQNETLDLANAFTGGDMETFVNRMHASCRSVKTCQDYELHTPSLTLNNHCQLNSPLA